MVPVVSSQPGLKPSRLFQLRTTLEPVTQTQETLIYFCFYIFNIKTMWKVVGCVFIYHHHGNSKVGSQLIVTPWAGGSITIFINVTFMHQVRVHLIRVLRVSRHPKSRFKRLLELLVPWGIRDKLFFTWNTRGGFYLTIRMKGKYIYQKICETVFRL